jgi:hypothetical protein
MKNEIYGSGNYQDFMNDSSNHAKEGEGVPEMLQRMSKERDLDMIKRVEADTKQQIVCAIGIPVIPEKYGRSKIYDVLPEICAQYIAKKLLGGEI